MIAGLDYNTPWTRDTAINIWNALSILSPEVSKNTLLAVLEEEEGNIYIGGQYWDSIIWMIRSEEYEGAGEMVSLLAKFFRTSLSQGKDMIRQAVEYINGHYTDENLSLKEVAGYTNVSANYFSAVFSQEMQQTFVEYLTKKRMERAKELLLQGDKRSAEIAAEVGYKDPHYFSFVFRKTQGCTPRDYRMGGRRG